MKTIRRGKRRRITGKTLQHTFEHEIKFSEVDSMAVVWHGNYVRFFEDGREAWGKKYGITYLDVYNNNFFIPIVSLRCEHMNPLEYGDTAIIETTFIDTPAAKLFFDYKIYRKRDGALSATGETTQVFLDTNKDLYLAMPEFYEEWKKKWNLL
ncbi:acyl-CoA thioesterase (plasmid) [Aureispira anguillae]|uniref:Acyl-CoA thioesterase n=1 Tax=Aureispira anguillae TaxID=2864201 RepID=A0A915YM89_9BACT|nr:acyl-CoA thioesterase [Aureispira anguillae]BDS15634.1 acyl-CoA thioesterase [Aureispira anguillae]